MKYYIALCLLFFGASVSAQTYAYNDAVDVQHYSFKLAVNDLNDTIKGTAMITVKYLKSTQELVLDLTQVKTNGKGMMVSEIREGGNNLTFNHQNDKINIKLNTAVRAGATLTYTVKYKGIPADGLIISKNKFGNRTMFSDNWPNRGHNWIPCVDHPSDKATVEFEVIAPDHYQVVSNGLMIEESNLPEHLRLTHWKESANLPVKVMAVGIADFAVQYAGSPANIPVYSWVFPENKGIGFYDYSEAAEILPWFIKNVGPYAYEKLANVQSKTIFGGMENASAIFYAESSVNGKHKTGELLAHEIAHQWFGNTVTEVNWPHLWLSEGFATYMTNLYMEGKYGKDTLATMLKGQRKTVIALSKTRKTPVVDTTVTNYMELLNANSYEKGAWALHMLRRKIGDALFWKGIVNYYAAFKGKNATTDDFRLTMEKTSKQDLKPFFKQWLQTPGQPNLAISWKYDAAKKVVNLTVDQQNVAFNFPLEIGFDGAVKSFAIKPGVNNFAIPVKGKPSKVVADPNTNLLFEGSVVEK